MSLECFRKFATGSTSRSKRLSVRESHLWRSPLVWARLRWRASLVVAQEASVRGPRTVAVGSPPFIGRNDLLIVKALRWDGKEDDRSGKGARTKAPASLVYRVRTTRLDGQARKILFWMLWDAHARSRWGRIDDPQVDLEVRYHAQDMLCGAGLIGEKGYRGLRVALEQLQAVRFHGAPDPLILGFVERPGPHFDVVLSAALAAEHARPLGRYALLNMEHIRCLRQPLDFAIYARACLVARARQPRFRLHLDEIAWIAARSKMWHGARCGGRFSGLCPRLRGDGGRIIIQAWCEGPTTASIICRAT